MPINVPFLDPSLGLNTYSFDYFSGSQISLRIDDIILDEAFYIRYSLNQSKVPIYGYASQYFNTVAAGTVLVTGSFLLNFKESLYLPAILKQHVDLVASTSVGSDTVSDSQRQEQVGLSGQEHLQGPVGSQASQVPSSSAGRVSAVEESDAVTVAGDITQMSDEEFERAAQQASSRIWGEDSRSVRAGSQSEDPAFTSNLRHGFRMDSESFRTHRRADQYPAFDILITAGDTSNRFANSTVLRLVDCHIIGDGQEIRIDGAPVALEYNFIAKTKQ